MLRRLVRPTRDGAQRRRHAASLQVRLPSGISGISTGHALPTATCSSSFSSVNGFDFAGEPISCRGAVHWGQYDSPGSSNKSLPNRPVSIENIEVSPPRIGEVRIRMLAAALSLSHDTTLLTDQAMKTNPDRSSSSSSSSSISSISASEKPPLLWQKLFPRVLGVEGAGIIESVGMGVAGMEPGDHVLTLPVPECGKCRSCRAGMPDEDNEELALADRTNLCELSTPAMRDLSSRITCRGRNVFPHPAVGFATLSEYAVVPEVSVAVINRAAPLQSALLLSGAVASGLGATLGSSRYSSTAVRSNSKYSTILAQQTQGVTAGSTVVVIGAGDARGWGCVQGAMRAGAARVFAVEKDPQRRKLARESGIFESSAATKVVLCGNVHEVQQALGSSNTNSGADSAFVCIGGVGSVEAQQLLSHAVYEALACCHRDDAIATIVAADADSASTVNTAMLPADLTRGRILRHSVFGGIKGRSELPGMVDAYLKGDLKLDEYVTYVKPLAELDDALDIVQSGTSIRTIIDLH